MSEATTPQIACEGILEKIFPINYLARDEAHHFYGEVGHVAHELLALYKHAAKGKMHSIDRSKAENASIEEKVRKLVTGLPRLPSHTVNIRDANSGWSPSSLKEFLTGVVGIPNELNDIRHEMDTLYDAVVDNAPDDDSDDREYNWDVYSQKFDIISDGLKTLQRDVAPGVAAAAAALRRLP